MKPYSKHESAIWKKLRSAPGIFPMFDFDGTLSAFAPTPEEATLSEENRRNLQVCSKVFPIAIISGRSLADIEKKVGVTGILYAGNHGLEWKMRTEDGKEHIEHVPLSKKTDTAFARLRVELPTLLQAYPGTLIEDKSFSIAVHYRRIQSALIPEFEKAVRRIAAPLVATDAVRVDDTAMVFDFRPTVDWHKGRVVRLLHTYIQKETQMKLLPVYVGDELTDEDAFVELREDGLTIRVGNTSGSAAQYYVAEREGVDTFLQSLTDFAQEKRQ